jgi:hypothetical protein
MRETDADTAARLLAIADAIRAECDVREHRIHKSMSGLAWLASGVIEAPEGGTPQELYVVAHEAAHIRLHGFGRGRSKPTYVRELEAEVEAHALLARYRVEVPREEALWAVVNVRRRIAEAIASGIAIDDPRAVHFMPGGSG